MSAAVADVDYLPSNEAIGIVRSDVQPPAWVERVEHLHLNGHVGDLVTMWSATVASPLKRSTWVNVRIVQWVAVADDGRIELREPFIDVDSLRDSELTPVEARDASHALMAAAKVLEAAKDATWELVAANA